MGLDHKEYLKEMHQMHEYDDFAKQFKRDTRTFIETFFNFQEASLWIEKHLEEYDSKEWFLEQCSINLINGGYRCGVVFSKAQMEMF